MEALYESIWSWVTEEDYIIPFTDWKVVDEYHDTVYPTSLSDNFKAVLLEAEILLNYCVERTVMLNDITQNNNKVLKSERNKTVKLHKPERNMEESVSTLQSVVETEQRSVEPHKKLPMTEN